MPDWFYSIKRDGRIYFCSLQAIQAHRLVKSLCPLQGCHSNKAKLELQKGEANIGNILAACSWEGSLSWLHAGAVPGLAAPVQVRKCRHEWSGIIPAPVPEAKAAPWGSGAGCARWDLTHPGWDLTQPLLPLGQAGSGSQAEQGAATNPPWPKDRPTAKPSQAQL